METAYHLVFLDGDALKERWVEVEAAIRWAFKDSEFNHELLTVEWPIRQTRDAVEGLLGPGYKHLVAVNGHGNIIGAIFNVPTRRDEDQVSTNFGWFFVSPEIDRTTRRHILDELMANLFAILSEVGFERIVTGMGTRAGAKVASQRYGFTHEPTKEKYNRWVKELRA
jgi:hypothetical protein